MQITFVATVEEMLAVVHSCLCSGLPILATSGVELEYDDLHYAEARAALKEPDPCIEDVQVQMLRTGQSLFFIDTENDEAVELNLELIQKNWSKARPKDLLDYINEDYDAQTSENIMQTLLYGEVVFG